MNTERYKLEADSRGKNFEFVSHGPKGAIQKLIEFQTTGEPRLFNLAFGDKDLRTGELDDLGISNNGDMEKTLATVADAVYQFCNENPMASVYISGSTKARTRLYRMAITKFFKELEKDFYLYGQNGADFSAFEPGKEYNGFLVHQKLL